VLLAVKNYRKFAGISVLRAVRLEAGSK
jgi:hypothetical protein